MLGINKIKIGSALLLQVTDIDEFKGLWRGLDRHTTGLQLLGDVADYGANFKQVLGPLEEHLITIDMIRAVNASQLGQNGVSDLKTTPNQLPISHERFKQHVLTSSSRHYSYTVCKVKS